MSKNPHAVSLGRKGGKSTSPAKQAAVRANVAKARKVREQKREFDGKYAFDGNLERLCVCGHTLSRHAAGSPADCLFYSLPSHEREGQPGADNPNCGCLKFRESRKASKPICGRCEKVHSNKQLNICDDGIASGDQRDYVSRKAKQEKNNAVHD